MSSYGNWFFFYLFVHSDQGLVVSFYNISFSLFLLCRLSVWDTVIATGGWTDAHYV